MGSPTARGATGPLDPELAVVDLFADILRGEKAPWPDGWIGPDAVCQVRSAVRYHGVAGLLWEKAALLGDWPEAARKPIREQAQAAAIWELRHRVTLTKLLDALSALGVPSLLMKGSAIAYDLYRNPASRMRADSDLLIRRSDAESARSTLQALGYSRMPFPGGLDEELALQESWTCSSSAGLHHVIDLHWHAMNSNALKDVFLFDECLTDAVELPRLAPVARAMDRVRMLLHACMHRSMHLTAPYFVDGIARYGADRLIWSHDIHLLAGSLRMADWTRFNTLVSASGMARPCLDGLEAARRTFGTSVPAEILDTMQRLAGKKGASAYLSRRRALPRAWEDLKAVPGGRAKIRHLIARLIPSATFLRAKYPGWSALPLPLLYMRRIFGLILPRTNRRRGRGEARQ